MFKKKKKNQKTEIFYVILLFNLFNAELLKISSKFHPMKIIQ